MNHLDVGWLLGRRFVTDFRVVSIGAGRPGVEHDPERVVVLHHLGDRSEISFGELRTLIETGFVAEAP